MFLIYNKYRRNRLLQMKGRGFDIVCLKSTVLNRWKNIFLNVSDKRYIGYIGSKIGPFIVLYKCQILVYVCVILEEIYFLEVQRSLDNRASYCLLAKQLRFFAPKMWAISPFRKEFSHFFGRILLKYFLATNRQLKK